MEIQTDKQHHCIRVNGRIDTNSSPGLDQALTALTEPGFDLIVDLSGCPYLSSAGIRAFLKANKRLREFRKELFLTGVSPEIYHVFEISGLHRTMRFEKTVESALAAIDASSAGEPETQLTGSGYHRFTFIPAGVESHNGYFSDHDAVLSLQELGYSLGFGDFSMPGESGTDLFASIGTIAGFIPSAAPQEGDFRMVSEPGRTGFHISEALSFGLAPAGLVRLQEPGIVTFTQVTGALQELNRERFAGNASLMLLLLNNDRNAPSLSLLLACDERIRNIVKEQGTGRMAAYLDQINPGNGFAGITITLSGPLAAAGEISPEATTGNLSIDHITGVTGFTPPSFLHDPLIWVFAANSFSWLNSRLLPIETTDPPLPPYMEFLTRLLYRDSSRVMLTPLTGGYSSHTFEVASFDHEGRRLRPTVMKIGKRGLIAREAERCSQYALPYIFNNSAVVLGSEFYGELGALRYNFVGIGGEETQLKWLSAYYRTRNSDFLEPLFDKIFLGILKPWYGQPVRKTINPYRDHDPTFTFFPHIYKTASELFNVDADEMYIQVPEYPRPILNPYWFLKHEFPVRRDHAIGYPTGICHGDLNMNNILLDEQFNVHLIDFSETRPRSIISDFARLEAIFLVDMAPLEGETGMQDYLHFIQEFYKPEKLTDLPEISYRGQHQEQVQKNGTMALKMRQYALNSTGGDPDLLPWYLALLEWVIPIVCYFSMPEITKRLSMLVSSMLCEKIKAR